MKKILFAALAATVLFASCAKDNGNEAVDSNETKSVFVQISNESGTRSEGDAIGTKAIVFNDGFIYFTNSADQITKRYTIGTPGDYTVAQLQAGQAISGVPGNSTKVFVVGNVPATVTLPSAGNISAIKTAAINVETQVDATAGVDMVSLYGAGDITGSGPYSAAFVVKPLAARVEIAKLTASGVITSYQVDGIFVNSYYPNSNLDGTIKGALVDNGSTVATYVGASAAYPATLPLYDYSASGIGTLSSLVYAPTTGSKVWYYNVMAPIDGSAVAPHIVIRLSNITTSDGSTFADPQFLTIKGFNDGTTVLAQLTAGKAYNIANVSFTQDNLTSEPEVEAISVSVKITLTEWTTVPVTPEF